MQLKVEANEDYFLLGIVSAEPDYRLSLAINRKFKVSLKHKSPIELGNERDSSLHFSKFSDNTGIPGMTINLISNKSGTEYFLKKLHKIDYLLQVCNPDNHYNRDYCTNALRSIDSITAVFALNPADIRDKNLKHLIP